jgi:hypothetical protein
MGVVNAAITGLFDLLLAPFGWSAWAGLVFISLLTGAVLLTVFRYTSNQRGIRATKDQIISHLLEVLLYRDDVRVVLRAQARLARDNLRYLGHALVPLAFMIVPVGFLLVQTDLRYGLRPLAAGEKAIVAVELGPGVDLDEVSLSASPGIEVETLPLRIPTLQEVDWRVKAVAPGKQELRISVGGEEFVKEIRVGMSGGRVSRARVSGGVWAQFLHPGEPPIPRDAGAKSVTVSYPSAEMELLGWRVHWVWPWLLISMAFGYALKGPLRVQV